MTNKEFDSVELENSGLPSAEVIAMTEVDLVKTLLEAASYKENEELWQPIEIQRKGKKVVKFRIRPLSEDEILAARKKATKYMPNPADKRLPLIEKEIDYSRLRSWKIYYATVDEDRKLLWNNKDVKDAFSEKIGRKIMESVEVIEMVLQAGEKDAISDTIDEISGYGSDSLVEYAKN